MTIPLSHQQFHQIYDLSTIGVLAIDAGAVIGYVNPAILTNTQLAKEQLIGHSLFTFYKDSAPGGLNKKKLLASEEIKDQEFSVNVKTGNEQWVQMSSKVHRDEQGNVLTYLFVQDSSQLKKKKDYLPISIRPPKNWSRLGIPKAHWTRYHGLLCRSLRTGLALTC